MPIEGIIDGLKEISKTYNLGTHSEYVHDAINALIEIDRKLDKAYAAGKYDQLQECFGDIIEEMAKGA